MADDNKYEPKALLEFGSISVMLPVEDAITAFKVLCNGECVTYSWEKKGYLRAKPESHGGVSLKMFSVRDYATLALSSVDE